MEITSYKIFDGLPDFDWDSFVDSHPEGRHCFLISYSRAIEKAYSLKTYRIVYYDLYGNVRGLFAGVLIKGFSGARKIVSMPYTDYGGFLLSNKSLLPDKILIDSLNDLLNISAAKHVLVHGQLNWGGEINGALFNEVADCTSAVLPLNVEGDITRLFDYSIRKNINRAIEKKLINREVVTPEIICKSFYPRYLKKMKEFGTPPHSPLFFTSLLDEMKEHFKFFTALSNDSSVSYLIGMRTKNVLHISYIVSEKDTEKIRHDDFIHWKMIEWAFKEKHQIFDFGVARYEGQKKYKLKWGVTLKKYSHFSYPKTHLSQSRRNLHNHSTINKFWSIAVPEKISAFIGPLIRKKLGK